MSGPEPEAPQVAPAPAAPEGPVLALSYESARDLRRDRLPDLPRGLMARVREALQVGSRVEVGIEARREKIRIRATAEARWVTPLGSGSLVGLALDGATSADTEQLDFLLRAGAVAPPASALLTPALPLPAVQVLAVAMLQPNPVLRDVLGGALSRLARQLGDQWTLRLDNAVDPTRFMAALASRPRQLAIVDCDVIRGTEASLLRAVRARSGCEKLPLVLLGEGRPAGLEDRFAVTMHKPLSVKAFVHTTSLLVRA